MRRASEAEIDTPPSLRHALEAIAHELRNKARTDTKPGFELIACKIRMQGRS
jgi:hypothetical protein